MKNGVPSGWGVKWLAKIKELKGDVDTFLKMCNYLNNPVLQNQMQL